jgi:prepilin-type N-terminal cleavage/methylation domain-containing protein
MDIDSMHRLTLESKGTRIDPLPRGFTLVELLLVTVVLGILASIVSPYFMQAREQAYTAQIQADVRHLMEGVETYVAMHDGAFPTSLEELEGGSTYVHTTEVQYCLFVAVPRSPGREPYILAQAGHPATTTKVFILYPIWGGGMIEFDSGQRGC